MVIHEDERIANFEALEDGKDNRQLPLRRQRADIKGIGSGGGHIER